MSLKYPLRFLALSGVKRNLLGKTIAHNLFPGCRKTSEHLLDNDWEGGNVSCPLRSKEPNIRPSRDSALIHFMSSLFSQVFKSFY